MNNVEEMLKEYPNVCRDILKLNQELARAMGAMKLTDGMKANVITGLPHSKDVSDPVFENISRTYDNLKRMSKEVLKLSETVKYQVSRKIEVKKNIDEALNLLTFKEKNVIRLRYFDYPEPKYKWDVIVDKSGLSRRQCFEIHEHAIKNIDKLLKNRTKPH